ncbi:MAG: calcium-binding protein [Nanoarchaeota archaeon]
MKQKITPSEKKFYEKVMEEAMVDCKDENEVAVGWEITLDENIPAPCNCTIGKEKVVLEKISLSDNGNSIIGIIKLNKTKMRVLIQDITLDNPKAMQYINAYKYWCKNGW